MPLSRFEALARRLVEGSFTRLFGGPIEPLEIATKLAQALEESQVDGRAADTFHVYLSPDDYAFVHQHYPHLADELAGYITQLAQQADISPLGRPQIQLSADPALGHQQVQVVAQYLEHPDDPTTEVLHRDELEEEAMAGLRARDAYLIVGGRQHVPLDRPVLTLGRRTDNDVVLDSPTISRQHAQIRWRYGRFVLYDLSRRGRTVVNSQVVDEHVLQPGDVIALSNLLLIYGEGRDERRQTDVDDEDEPTLILPPKQEKE